MNGKKYIDGIIDLLSCLEAQIKNVGGLHLYDRNKHCEDLFKRFLNLMYSYNLQNVNLSQENFPAIDLGDSFAKKCIQITSDASAAKIKKTISLFIQKGLYEQYTNLTILIISKKGTYDRVVFDTQDKFEFIKTRDIIDQRDLIKDIIASSSVERIRIIHDFLEKELSTSSGTTKSNEVETIMDFISFLSEERSNGNEVSTGDPDPEKKILERFASQADYLKQQLQDYIPVYQTARLEAENKLGLDKVMITLIRRFLMDKSVSVLETCNQDPKKALEELVKYFENELSSNGNNYDYGAIRYYLLQEIINCNVFPNP